jgi:nucleoside-diphosphate-sugar epimerase
MRIAVTGGSGKLGRHVVRRLTEDGHQVLNLDRAGTRSPGLVVVDLRNYGQVLDVLLGLDDRHEGFDAVVHLGAIPAPGIIPDAATFENNMLSTYNVFQAARRAGIKKVVYASSETVLGLPFDVDPPYIPVDVEDYEKFPSFDSDATLRKWNLWGYIDGRDGAQAVARALENGTPGFEAFIIANADTVMSRSSASLAAEVFPGVKVVKELGEHETMLSIDKARRLLGFEPEHTWRDHWQDPAGSAQS